MQGIEDLTMAVLRPSSTNQVGWTDFWPNPAPLQPYWPIGVTVSTADLTVHHVAFPLKAGTQAPCGTPTGQRPRNDRGQGIE